MEEIGVKVSVLRHLGVIEYYEEDGRHTISNVYLAKIIDGKPRGSVQGKEIAFFKKGSQKLYSFSKEIFECIVRDNLKRPRLFDLF